MGGSPVYFTSISILFLMSSIDNVFPSRAYNRVDGDDRPGEAEMPDHGEHYVIPCEWVIADLFLLSLACCDSSGLPCYARRADDHIWSQDSSSIDCNS